MGGENVDLVENWHHFWLLTVKIGPRPPNVVEKLSKFCSETSQKF